MINRAQLKFEAKESLRIGSNWGVAIGVFIVYSIISAALTWFVFGTLVLGLTMETGLCIVFMSITRRNETEFSELFGGFNTFGTTVIAGLLRTLFVFLWSLLLIIPGIVKAYAYAMVPYIIADNPEIGGKEALDLSQRMMQGHKMELFVLHLSFILWWLLVIVTFGIGILYVGPYMKATETRFYDTIKFSPQPDTNVNI